MTKPPRILFCVCTTITLAALQPVAHAADRSPREQSLTIRNPLNLDHRFELDAPPRREVADPAVVYFDNEYWLFASKSGGYWHSPDFVHAVVIARFPRPALSLWAPK